MIQVKITRDRSDQIMQVEVKGHAESGPYGYDLVCAAVSVVTIGTANNLRRLTDERPKLDADEDQGGYLSIRLSNHEQDLAVTTLMDSLFYTLKDIEESYADHIQITEN